MGMSFRYMYLPVRKETGRIRAGEALDHVFSYCGVYPTTLDPLWLDHVSQLRDCML